MTEAMLLYDFTLIVKEHGGKQYIWFARTVSHSAVLPADNVVGVVNMLTKYRPGDYWPLRPCTILKQIA